MLKLTAREQEIMEYVSKGLSNIEIAKQIYLSESCVKTHVHNILIKLNVDSRLQAILIFLQKYKGINFNNNNDINKLTMTKHKNTNGEFVVHYEYDNQLSLENLKWFHQQLFEKIKELELEQYINERRKQK